MTGKVKKCSNQNTKGFKKGAPVNNNKKTAVRVINILKVECEAEISMLLFFMTVCKINS